LALSDVYSDELRSQLARAAKQGMKHLLINARELLSSVGNIPSANDKMISCRLAMRIEMTAGDTLLVAENNAASMTVRYLLPRSFP
jgi:hypothetical protein